ncbi:hypothetical protein [Streptomyces sp. NPDC007063]|uniref:hypothetical protein n=1 Tax=Streptomyces sp. NPDC007063 TaxID=3364772 RepID=UPI0036BDD798
MHPQHQPQHRHRPPRPRRRIPVLVWIVGGLAVAVIAVAMAVNSGSTNATRDSKPSATPKTESSDRADAEKAAGIPPKPTGADRAAYLRAIAAVDPALTAEPDKAIDAGRNQCAALGGGASNTDHFAAERFGNDAHPLTDAEGAELNEALRGTLCPKE